MASHILPLLSGSMKRICLSKRFTHLTLRCLSSQPKPVEKTRKKSEPVKLLLDRGVGLAEHRPLSTHLGCAHYSTRQAPSEKPSVSSTSSDESESFVMNIFKGKLKVDQAFPFPEVLNEEQLEMLQMMAPQMEKFLAENNDPFKNDLNEKFDEDFVKQLKEMGAMGIQVPEEYGGLGMNNTQYCRMGCGLGYNDLALGIFVGAHQSIGFKGILLYGTPEQKEKYLPDLASGKKIAAFCLTEPGHGSDAANIQSKAVLSEDGSHYILNGSKIWISNGGFADVMTVFARTPVETPEGTVDKMSAFIVERDFGGVTSGPPEKKMGIKASNTTEVYYENTKIPKENLLGPLGSGFKVAMNILNNGRFGMAAALCGTCRWAVEKAVQHATTRVQFGSTLSSFGMIQEKIVRMSMQQYMIESMAFMVSGVMDRGFTDYQLEAAISKVFASEGVWSCVDEALQIYGGMGFMKETGIEKVLRDARIFRIFEGANDVLRLFIALSGLQYAGSHLKELQRAIKSPMENLGLILDEGTKRVKRAVGLGQGLSLAEHVHPDLAGPASLVPKRVEDFGACVEYMLIKHGKDIINQQFLLWRLANATIDIYSMVVCLSRASLALEKKLPSAQYEAALVDIICQEASVRIQSDLGIIQDPNQTKNFQKMSELAKQIFEHGGVINLPPTDTL